MNDALGGVWTNNKSYDHILKIGKGQNQFDVISRYNLLKGVKPDMFSDSHRFAHHLTSSQVMCYNYFRPLINENRTMSDKLIRILEERHIHIPNNCICEFEASNPLDNTSYDMAIGHAKFEIKFTEYGFGKAKSDERHKIKFETIYKDLIRRCICLKDEPDMETFFRYYQLFRNILHIDSVGKYAIFIFPKGNKKCSNEINDFYTLIDDKFKNNIQVWYWEDLLVGKEDCDFYKKYLR